MSFTIFPIYCIFFFTWHNRHGIFLTQLQPEFSFHDTQFTKISHLHPLFQTESICHMHSVPAIYEATHASLPNSYCSTERRNIMLAKSLSKPALHLNSLRYKIIITLYVLTKYEMTSCQIMDTYTCFE
jgi:hypothetical protein